MQKKLQSETIYNGSIFHLTKDEVEIETGLIVQRDVIHHHGGAGILAINDGQILLVSQYRYAAQKQLWEIPAGKLEQDELPEVCAMRELEEETGYSCKNLTPICEFFSTPGFCSEKLYLFLAEDVQKVEHPHSMDEDEVIAQRWFDQSEILSMLHHKEIQDAKTLIALQYALMHQK